MANANVVIFALKIYICYIDAYFKSSQQKRSDLANFFPDFSEKLMHDPPPLKFASELFD